MAAYVPCGHCYKNSSCSLCPPELRPAGNPPFSTGCPGCIRRSQRSLDDLRNDLTAEHAKTKREVQQLQAEIVFLKLNNVDREPSNSNSFEGDLEIEVQGCVLQAHRLILAEKSTVFRKMFEIQMVEKETGVVRIQDTTLPVMRAVIEFCYSAEISFTDETTPEEVLKSAHKYDIRHLRDVCATALVAKINDGNLAEMLRLSTLCDAKELQEAAFQYLRENFDGEIPSFLREVFSSLTQSSNI